jgi:hypothetical protein
LAFCSGPGEPVGRIEDHSATSTQDVGLYSSLSDGSDGNVYDE